MELQHETERHLIKIRMQAENEYEIEVAEWRSKIKDPEELRHILGLMKIKHTKKLHESDTKIIEILDQKVKNSISYWVFPIHALLVGLTINNSRISNLDNPNPI